MKKFISFLLVSVLMLNFSAALVFADNADYTDKFIDIMYNEMLKGSYDGTISVKNNSSWEFIDELIKADETEPDGNNYENSMAQLFDAIDIKALAESAVNIDGTIKADYNISENYDKIQMYAAFTLNKPIVLNESLSFSVDTAFEMYLDSDFSDLKNPVYKITMKYPINKKYIYIDYSEIIKQTLSQFPDSEISEEVIYSSVKTYMNNLITATKASYKKNAAITYSNNTYTMKMDDKGFKNFIFDVFDAVFNSMDFVKFMSPETENFEENLTEMKKEFENFKLLANKITILGENGYTILCKVDNNNKPCEINSSVDISINLYDIANVFGIEDMAADLSKIGRDKCGIGITASENYKLSNVGTDIAIGYPVLTSENSVNFAKLMEEQTKQEQNYAGNDFGFPHDISYFSSQYNGYRIERDGENYLPVRAIADGLCIPDENIMVGSNGIITLLIPDTVNLPFKTLSFYENGNSFFVDGQEFWIEHPTFETDGATYLPLCALNLINIDIISIETSEDFDPNTGEATVYTWFHAYLNK